jgi:cyclopropane fatty-acyl-phospholipid synthase-like methyltransferase
MPTDLAIPDLGSRRLEVGCGSRARAAKGARYYVGVDVVENYLDEAPKGRGKIYMLADWEQVLDFFQNDSFDAVYAIDFIEHLDRRKGKRFLHAAARVAPATAVFTPLGPMPQSPRNGMRPGDPDSQRHRSAWTPDDFPGWQIKRFRDFHRQLADGTPLEQPIGAFWAIRR